MWLYIVGWFLLIVVALTTLAFRLAPDELAEVRAMLAVLRARKRGRHRG
jgi:hypothetical protein